MKENRQNKHMGVPERGFLTPEFITQYGNSTRRK